MKYKAILASTLVTLVMTGCGAGNDEANENLGMNRTNQNNYDNPRNVSDPRVENQDGQNQWDQNRPYGTQDLANNPNERNNQGNQQNDNNLRVSEEISRRVENLKEVKRAHVIVANEHAYVGAVLAKGQDEKMSDKLKDRIANAVRSEDTTIEKVHVSTNPDFVQKMRQYESDVKNGHPISGFGDEFHDLITRVFPTSK